jgi:hypothetical protein
LEDRAGVAKLRESLPDLIVLDGQDFRAHRGIGEEWLKFRRLDGHRRGRAVLLSLASVELMVVTLVLDCVRTIVDLVRWARWYPD